MLLRYGKKVVAVGRIPDDKAEYRYLPQFDDVLGWDIQHGRRVIWETSPALLSVLQSVFAAQKQAKTFTRVIEERVSLSESDLRSNISLRTLKPLPQKVGPPLNYDELGTSLFKARVSNEAVEHALATIAKSFVWMLGMELHKY